MNAGREIPHQTMVIEIYDAHAEERAKAPVHIATITTDGRSGRIEVVKGAEEYERMLDLLFSRPRVRMVAGGTVGGSRVDAATSQPAWAPKTIQAIIDEDLKLNRLRAEIRYTDDSQP